jgi:thiosulfate dehydrogenase
MMRPNLAIVLISLVFLPIDLALADGATIALHGNDRGALACITCHGPQGEGTPANGFPKLAGLNAGYLKAQLDAFAKSERNNVIMTPIAQNLNGDERAKAARYYAGLKSPATPPQPASEMNSPRARLEIQEGEQLALKGRRSQDLPACVQCHGPHGVGVGANFPKLAGQVPLYIENRLRALQHEERPIGPAAIMKGVASKLSAKDIQNVAAYFSALPANGR